MPSSFRDVRREAAFLVISKYGGGGRRGSIVVPEGLERKGWSGRVIELRNDSVVSDGGRRRGGLGGSL